MQVKSVHVRIEGKVQGVWFRAWTAQEATRLGLDGWVRNRHDRSVEAVLSGPTAKVDELLDLLWQGPPAAHVTAVYPKPTDRPAASGFLKKATV